MEGGRLGGEAVRRERGEGEDGGMKVWREVGREEEGAAVLSGWRRRAAQQAGGKGKKS